MPDYGGFVAVGTSSYGGGQDGYYGNFSSNVAGPTSYNAYGLGSPGNSVYIGTNLGQPLPGSVFDPVAGRVTNNTNAVLYNQNGKAMNSGPPAYMLSNFDRDVKNVADENKYKADSARGPILKFTGLPGGEARFNSNQSYKDYLVRSSTYLIPESAVSNALTNMYGRAASAADIFEHGKFNQCGRLTQHRPIRPSPPAGGCRSHQ